MSLEQVRFVAIAFSLVTLWKTFVDSKTVDVERVAKIEFKVDTIWGFLMRRAEGDPVKGIATKNSPLRMIPESLTWMDPIKADLQILYKDLIAKNMSEGEIMLYIERKFGSWMLHAVCIPRTLAEGACLMIALAIAKGSTEIHLTYGPDDIKRNLPHSEVK